MRPSRCGPPVTMLMIAEVLVLQQGGQALAAGETKSRQVGAESSSCMHVLLLGTERGQWWQVLTSGDTSLCDTDKFRYLPPVRSLIHYGMVLQCHK